MSYLNATTECKKKLKGTKFGQEFVMQIVYMSYVLVVFFLPPIKTFEFFVEKTPPNLETQLSTLVDKFQQTKWKEWVFIDSKEDKLDWEKKEEPGSGARNKIMHTTCTMRKSMLVKFVGETWSETFANYVF